jgi:hypothetical protein
VVPIFSGETWNGFECRGESHPITITLSGGTQTPPSLIGMLPFQVDYIPEPSVSNLIIRRGISLPVSNILDWAFAGRE